MLKVALIGAGKMGISHLAILGAHPEVEIVGVCDTSKMVLDVLGKYSGFDCFTDYIQMVDQIKPDAVFVAVPTKFHYLMVKELLARGIHIFTDKSFCLNPNQIEELFLLAKSENALFEVGDYNKFVENCQKVNKHVKGGYIGASDYFNYKLFGGNLSDIPLNKKLIINTINQYSFCVAEKDEDFKSALMSSDILLPDGIGIVLSNLLIYYKKIKKIAGADLHEYLLNNLNQKKGKCFYLGASDTTLNSIKENLSKDFPNICFSSFSPPFKEKFSDVENWEMITRINDFQPDVLFVGMTAPKQEKWVYQNKQFLNPKIICSIGAVFDFYAGTVKRPNKIFINSGFEWLGRFFEQPRKMWKRYFFYGPVFLCQTMAKIFSTTNKRAYEGKIKYLSQSLKINIKVG